MPFTKNTQQMGINHELLKDLMQDKKLTPAIMESRTKIPEQTVKNIINGKTGNPGIENLAPICKELGIPIESVLFSHSKEIETKILKEEPSAHNLKEMYEFQIATITKAHETEITNIRNHYERQLTDQKAHYEKYISVTEAHYEKRLTDKREHIDTIMLDKKWFRLAAVVSVIAVLAIFLFIEFATPGHGWFTFGENSSAPAFVFVAIILTIAIVVWIITSKKKRGYRGLENEEVIIFNLCIPNTVG